MADPHLDPAVAAEYDDDLGAMFDPATVGPAVDVLAELAADGAALEFGIGTGRIALPLAQRGVTVHGVDLSAPMVTKLREKAGGADIPVTIGDFATVRLDERFRLVYLVFNTIMNLTTQDEQVACFENAARHLEPGGSFVIETMVPDLQRLPPGETIRPFRVEEQRLGFDEYEVLTQHLTSHHYWATDGQLRRRSGRFRYVWPAELDLMARIAGLALADRWSGWDRAPFTATSRSHVSRWRRAETDGPRA